MSHWTIEPITPQPGRVAIVTGGNNGIGYETALGLAQKGIRVVLACRNRQKAEAARTQLGKACPGARVETLDIDLSRLESVQAFAASFQQRHSRLDLLINNAGIMMSPYERTVDGFENQLATNYLGHFVLTGLLLPLLTQTPGSRVVTLSSLSYKWAEIQFGDFHAEKGYSRAKAYGQSKRACLMFAYELHHRLMAAGSGSVSVAAHPGLCQTNLDQYFPALVRPLGNLFLQPAQKGALSVLYAALASSITGGEYIGPDGFQEIRGYPIRVDSDAYSRDRTIAGRLWRATEAMTGCHYLDNDTPTK